MFTMAHELKLFIQNVNDLKGGTEDDKPHEKEESTSQRKQTASLCSALAKRLHACRMQQV